MRFTDFHKKLMAVLLACCLVLTHVGDAEAAKKKKRPVRKPAVSRAMGVNDPRYADIILNPQTGELYHSDDPDGKRYPASLTKVMTLYLLFEALEMKKLSLDDDMRVSEYAASMPQTNLSLDAGDRIDVETAIKALVVRSANDVSVVVAEHLAGDVETFAQRMTAKARSLGMKNTTFKNPNGLPNGGQVTSARDMAKLGIAVKRDFPRYYPYFSTLQFSHNGVTYYTHNRVLLRYAGADGTKTGYIGLSGFNLITSVVRGGRPMVGVVMGGTTGAWRDNRMIQLLDEGYKKVAERGAARGKSAPSNLPLSKLGGKQPVGINTAEDFDPNALDAAAKAKTVMELSSIPESDETLGQPPETLLAADMPDSREQVRDRSPFEAAERAALESRVTNVEEHTQSAPGASAPVAAPAAKPVQAAPTKSVELAPTSTVPQAAAPAPGQPAVVLAPRAAAPAASTTVVRPAPPARTAPATPVAPVATAPAPTAAPTATAPAPAPVATAPAAPVMVGDRTWGIQVGAFSTQDLANQALSNALTAAPKSLASARIALMGPHNSGVPVHRARLENLTQDEAKKACEALISNNSPCFTFNAAP